MDDSQPDKMSPVTPLTNRTGFTATAALAFFCLAAPCRGQGTTTITFEGQPKGTQTQVASYTEAGLRFSVIAPGSLYLSGGGIAGYPDNGTGYLEIPDAFAGGGGMTLGPTNASPTSAPFNLISFDAAVYDGLGPQSLEIVGYKPMAGTVINYFNVSGQTFQTFSLDSSFTGLFRVDFLTARWSLDNLVTTGVPEPATSTLLLLGAFCGIGYARARSGRPSRE
jgi:hypothetical protein